MLHRLALLLDDLPAFSFTHDSLMGISLADEPRLVSLCPQFASTSKSNFIPRPWPYTHTYLQQIPVSISLNS